MDRLGIASRLRGLMGGQSRGDTGELAVKLGVDEVSLRMSIDEMSPYPTVDVLAAAVTIYGVDPTWLLTGNYNLSTHRSAADGERATATDAVRSMLAVQHPTAEPTDEPRLRLMREG